MYNLINAIIAAVILGVIIHLVSADPLERLIHDLKQASEFMDTLSPPR